MPYDSTYGSTATSSLSARRISRPALPPSLRLTIPQEIVGSSSRLGGSRFTIKGFGRALHQIISPRPSGMIDGLERVGEATVGENAVRISRTADSINHRTTGSHASRPSASTVSQSTTSHIPMPCSPRTLITSFPPLNVFDIPHRSPTNSSPFSAILLSEGDEESEDDPALALWHTEQLHRARLAKLTRHLGEEIPAELVLTAAFLSHETSRFPAHSRRGGDHYKRRSFDPLSSMQGSHVTRSAEEILRRSKSLMEQGNTHRAWSVTGITPKMSSMECNTSGSRDTETTAEMVPIPYPAPLSSTTSPEYSTSLMDSDVLHEKVSYGPLHSSRPLGKSSSTAASVPLPHASPKSGTLLRRPATADASRRVEKLASFFGVAHDDLSAVPLHHGQTTQKVQSSSVIAAGDRATGMHELEVEVKVSKPARFWNSRASTKSIDPDDVMEQLRTMKAS